MASHRASSASSVWGGENSKETRGGLARPAPARAASVQPGTLYRTGELVSICLSGSPPTIALLGANPFTVTGDSYAEPGATVNDPTSSNPTYAVTGTVNVNFGGTYTLTYTATNANGSASVTRSVIVPGRTRAFAGSSSFGLSGSTVRYINLQNNTESLGFSEANLDSSNYFKTTGWVFTFAAKIIKAVDGGYPRLLHIQHGTSAASDIIFNAPGGSALQFNFDGGVAIGTHPYTIGATLYLIMSINSSTRTVTLTVSSNRNGASSTTYTVTSSNNPDSMLSTVGNRNGKWAVGLDCAYPAGQYGTNWPGSIQEIVVADKTMTFAECWP